MIQINIILRDYAKDGGVIDLKVTELIDDHQATIDAKNDGIVDTMKTYCTTHEDAQFTNTGAVQSLIVETKELTGASKQTAYETEINEVVRNA